MTGEDLRLLSLRSMTVLLGEYGLAERICKTFDVTAEDLDQLALVEVECRKIVRSRTPKSD